MPLRFRIDEDLGLVITTAEGEVTGDDLAMHARALARVPNRPLAELVDFSDRADLGAPALAVRDTGDYLHDEDENAPGGRVAMVAKTDTIYGMCRIFAAHRQNDDIEVSVFRDRDEALRWLGISAPGAATSR